MKISREIKKNPDSPSVLLGKLSPFLESVLRKISHAVIISLKQNVQMKIITRMTINRQLMQYLSGSGVVVVYDREVVKQCVAFIVIAY